MTGVRSERESPLRGRGGARLLRAWSWRHRCSSSAAAVAMAFAAVALAVFVIGTLRDRLRYSTEPATYSSDDGTGAATMVATVYRRRGASPFPAVSIVQGSEHMRRDRYHSFAERFVREGYVVAAHDAVGVGAEHDLQQNRGRIAGRAGEVVAEATVERRESKFVREEVWAACSNVPGRSCFARSTGIERGLVSMYL